MNFWTKLRRIGTALVVLLALLACAGVFLSDPRGKRGRDPSQQQRVGNNSGL
jgi:hypothetical protein